MDTSALQAVVGTNGKVQILNLLVELSVGLLVFRSEDGNYFALFVFLHLVKHEECAHVLVNDVCSTAHSLGGVDGAISLNFKNKLVIVGALANAGVGNAHGAATNRREQRVNVDDADRIFRALVALGRYISAAHANADGHLKRAAVSNSCDDVLGVDQREFSRNLEIGTSNGARTLSMYMRSGLANVTVKGTENQALNVQDDIGDVLDYALSGGELMLYTINLNCSRLCSVERRKQNTTHAVAKSVTVATL